MKSVTEAGVYAQDPFNSNIRYFEMDIVLLQKSRAAEFNSNIRYFEMLAIDLEVPVPESLIVI